MSARIGIVGVGHTRFGNSSEYDLADVMAYAATDALLDAGILEKRREVDQVFVANMASGLFCNQTSVASSMVSRMDMEPVPAELIENGPASGASAVKVAYMAIASGMADVVLVVGGEIMRKVTGWQATDIVATMLHSDAEYKMGLTLPSFGGMFARLYMDKYGCTERDLALIAVKDHDNGAVEQVRPRPRRLHHRSHRRQRDGSRRQQLCRRAAANLFHLPGQRRRGGVGAGEYGFAQGEAFRQEAGPYRRRRLGDGHPLRSQPEGSAPPRGRADRRGESLRHGRRRARGTSRSPNSTTPS